MKKLLFLLLASVAFADDVKISDLPLGAASGTHLNDSFPYVDSLTSTTKRLKLFDLINLPSMVSTYATLASPALTGSPTAPTQAANDNSTKIATTAYVDALASTPDATATVKGKLKLAGDLGGTASLPTVPGLLLKAPLISPALTGTPTAPTASPGDNSTNIATTAFVFAAVSGGAGGDVLVSVNFASSPYTPIPGVTVISCDATGGNVVVNLPTLSSSSNTHYYLKKTDNTANTCRFHGNGGELIDGAVDLIESLQYQSRKIFNGGTKWLIL